MTAKLADRLHWAPAFREWLRPVTDCVLYPHWPVFSGPRTSQAWLPRGVPVGGGALSCSYGAAEKRGDLAGWDTPAGTGQWLGDVAGSALGPWSSGLRAARQAGSPEGGRRGSLCPVVAALPHILCAAWEEPGSVRDSAGLGA